MIHSFEIHRIQLFIIVAIIVLSSCRERMTEVLNPDSLTTNELRGTSFYGQMITIWEGINTSYVFWKIDTVDWDARRDTMFAWAKNLDARIQKQQSINLNKEQNTFMSFFDGLVDHHMSIHIKNPYTYMEDSFRYFWAMPALTELLSRDYVHYEIEFNAGVYLLNQMAKAGTISISNFEYGSDGDIQVISCIINGNIAYMRLNKYAILSKKDHSAEVQKALFDHLARIKDLNTHGKLKAIILDNRSNGGGYASDIRWVVGLYIKEPIVCQYYRTKNGMGRYDYTPEQPLTVQPYSNSEYYIGDLGNVKYVVLQDIYSASMGEITGNAISQLPNGCTIGDRTMGAHGALNPTMYDGTWTGPFAYNLDDKLSVYTSTYLARTWNWQKKTFEYLEGVGFEPMIKCIITERVDRLRQDTQLMRAIQYINEK